MLRRRFFPSNCLYEITLRARKGLPFVPNETMKLLLKSAMARTQRDSKVILCHYLWMGNHAHILVVSKDATQLESFYAELQKRLCDYIKRLLGWSHLNLWESRPSVIRILDFDAALNRIAYFYANPARADLIGRIEEYPGLSSYSAFLTALPFTQFQVAERVHWIRCPAIPKLNCRKLHDQADRHVAASLITSIEPEEELVLHPNAWMSVFDVSSPIAIAEAMTSIANKIKSLELEAQTDREARNKTPLGVKALLATPIMRDHQPKSRSRRLFVISTCKEPRKNYIRHVNSLAILCRSLYERWLSGDYNSPWPPGTFPPSRPLSANAFD